MAMSSVGGWTEAPLRRFVQDAQVHIVLLLNTSGQVLSQYGFTRSMDVMSACALASAIHATASELGRRLEDRPFSGSHVAGKARQFFLAPLQNRQGTQLVCAVFDSQTSIGLVRLYFGELAQALADAAPEPADEKSVTAQDFERELNRNLAALFGRA
jgi:predicted regulator of Ras-like GTPase activity (Roadblock/LC7/MglB family)